jgi:addiction module HigA family antidote
MRKIKRQPTHPGKIIKEDYLEPLSITIKDMAGFLGISRKTMSKIINERGSVTPDMALRLSRAFDTTPDLWLNLQKNYDLWNALQQSKEWKKVKPIPIHLLQSRKQINSEQLHSPDGEKGGGLTGKFIGTAGDAKHSA